MQLTLVDISSMKPNQIKALIALIESFSVPHIIPTSEEAAPDQE